MTKDPRPAAVEILARIARLERYRAGAPFPPGTDDRDVVERCLEVISEASRRLPEGLKADHPEIAWRHLADLGNALRHAYDTVSQTILTEIIQHHLDPLRLAVIALLDGLEP